MKCKMEITMENEAFTNNPAFELAMILIKQAKRLQDYGLSYQEKINLMDSNGNKVGTFIIKK